MFTLFSRMIRPRRRRRQIMRLYQPSAKFESYSQLKNQSNCSTKKTFISRKQREMIARREAEIKIGTGNLPVMYSRFLDDKGNHLTDDRLIYIRLGRKGIIISENDSQLIAIKHRTEESVKKNSYTPFEQPSIISQNEERRRLRNQRACSEPDSSSVSRSPRRIICWNRIKSISCRGLQLRIELNTCRPTDLPAICVLRFLVESDLKSFVTAGMTRNYFQLTKLENPSSPTSSIRRRVASLFSFPKTLLKFN